MSLSRHVFGAPSRGGTSNIVRGERAGATKFYLGLCSQNPRTACVPTPPNAVCTQRSGQLSRMSVNTSGPILRANLARSGIVVFAVLLTCRPLDLAERYMEAGKPGANQCFVGK
jgi:hypothetical protein